MQPTDPPDATSAALRLMWLPRRVSQCVAMFVVSAFFLYAGITHFTNPDFYVSIVPPYLPAPLALVWISGAAEIAGALGVLLPRTRQWAGWGLILLLAAVYPANIHMAMHPELYPDIDPLALYVRLPLQFVAAAIVWWGTRPEPA